LNANYIRGFAESDLAWHREQPAEDFVGTLADGRRIDKATFLELKALGSGVTEIDHELVEIKRMGEVALVHGTTLYARSRLRYPARLKPPRRLPRFGFAEHALGAAGQ
jgi:hypothetical protein